MPGCISPLFSQPNPLYTATCSPPKTPSAPDRRIEIRCPKTDDSSPNPSPLLFIDPSFHFWASLAPPPTSSRLPPPFPRRTTPTSPLGAACAASAAAAAALHHQEAAMSPLASSHLPRPCQAREGPAEPICRARPASRSLLDLDLDRGSLPPPHHLLAAGKPAGACSRRSPRQQASATLASLSLHSHSPSSHRLSLYLKASHRRQERRRRALLRR